MKTATNTGDCCTTTILSKYKNATSLEVILRGFFFLVEVQY
jgi:hypothetical protein